VLLQSRWPQRSLDYESSGELAEGAEKGLVLRQSRRRLGGSAHGRGKATGRREAKMARYTKKRENKDAGREERLLTVEVRKKAEGRRRVERSVDVCTKHR
jgi:hypothetical protein